MAWQWERVDEDLQLDHGLDRIHLRASQRQHQRTLVDLRMSQAPSSWQKKRQGGWGLRQLAEVILDDALIQDDGFYLIKGEPDRCWEVTQDQDKASKIEKALLETQRDVKTDINFMYVARRKLNIQQQEKPLGTPLPAVVNGDATLRDAKLAESSNDKVVMWTGGSYYYDDVVRAGESGF